MTQQELFYEIVALPPALQDEVADFVAFIKKRRLSERQQETLAWQPLSLGLEKFPTNLDDYAVQPAQIEPLIRLFEDAPDAETLSKMLTT
jgi:hypothetical protein